MVAFIPKVKFTFIGRIYNVRYSYRCLHEKCTQAYLIHNQFLPNQHKRTTLNISDDILATPSEMRGSIITQVDI